MNARSKAEFINSVAAGETIICKQCGTANEADSKFCSTCGSKIEAAPVSAPAKESAFAPVSDEPAKESAFAPVSDEPAKESAFAPLNNEPAMESAAADENKQKPAFVPDVTAFPAVKENSEPAPETNAVKEPPVSQYVEPKSVFAEGLPEWSIEPPQVLVRRH